MTKEALGRERCVGKIVYSSWDEAEEAARVLQDDLLAGKLRIQKKGVVLAYRCDYCTNWHIGHTTSHQVRSSWNSLLRREAR